MLRTKRWFFIAVVPALLMAAIFIVGICTGHTWNVFGGFVCVALFAVAYLGARYEVHDKEWPMYDTRIEELKELLETVEVEPANIPEAAPFFEGRYYKLIMRLRTEFSDVQEQRKEMVTWQHVAPTATPTERADTLLDTVDDIATGIAIGNLADGVVDLVGDGISAAIDSLSD
jgi:hypothetical protein